MRAILGLPIGTITAFGPSASAVVLRDGHSQDIRYQGVGEALALVPGAQLRLFGKPEIAGRRRLGVALARGQDCTEAVEHAKAVAARVEVLF